MIALVATASFLLLGAHAPTILSVPIEAADSLALEIALPSGWTLSQPPAPEFHGRLVVFAANNRNDKSLAVAELRKEHPGGGVEISFSPESFRAALKPGTVYVDVWYQNGGPMVTSTPYAWSNDEQPANGIKAGLKSPDDAWTQSDVMIWRASFVHWGVSFSAFVAARPPYSQRDLKEAFSILESLRFPDTPVMHPLQAAEVAIPALPDEFRRQFLPDPKCNCCRRYTVETTASDHGFHVTFNLLDSQTGKLVRSGSVDVDHAGKATAR